MINSTRYHLSAEINRQQKLAADIARAQSDISNETRLQRPSDDPAASARVADIRRAQANEGVWAKNIDAASALATRADSALSGITSMLDRARELMTFANNGTYNDADRKAFAVELRSIAAEIGDIAQTKDSRGQLLFPDSTPLAVPIGPGVFIAPSVPQDGMFTNLQTASGPKGLAAIISGAADAIELTDKAEREAASTIALDEVLLAVDNTAIVRGDQGVRAARLDSARERFASSGLVHSEERGKLENTDIPETVAKLQAKQLSLEAAQAVFTRINRQTLFDLLG
ncbi:flagellar hook-associated protein 3 FlgL [Sphingomonas laterariae]|uniref:Flagellar hook-associated protein 3 FlgL n=1 Tax=Edaphosphingomonas laterariae TaxID=861865 RepID=A0A239HVP0_9SPHN|nr:flagellin-like protein [Sphingomonas laterariae]SNS84244.1 flagellar hook-associated protein 3 FlgL [Sphingomonas laterariae]